MSKVSPYALGYSDGYKAGYDKGSENPAKKIIDKDLVYIYGMLCIRLSDIGYSRKEIEHFCEVLQEMWVNEYQLTFQKKDAGLPIEKFEHKVKRITGVDLLQVFGLEEIEDDNS